MLIPAQNEPLNWKVQINSLFEKRMSSLFTPLLSHYPVYFHQFFILDCQKPELLKKLY